MLTLKLSNPTRQYHFIEHSRIIFDVKHGIMTMTSRNQCDKHRFVKEIFTKFLLAGIPRAIRNFLCAYDCLARAARRRV